MFSKWIDSLQQKPNAHHHNHNIHQGVLLPPLMDIVFEYLSIDDIVAISIDSQMRQSIASQLVYSKRLYTRNLHGKYKSLSIMQDAILCFNAVSGALCLHSTK